MLQNLSSAAVMIGALKVNAAAGLLPFACILFQIQHMLYKIKPNLIVGHKV